MGNKVYFLSNKIIIINKLGHERPVKCVDRSKGVCVLEIRPEM